MQGKLQEVEAENKQLKTEIQEAKAQMVEKSAKAEDQVTLEPKHPRAIGHDHK